MRANLTEGKKAGAVDSFIGSDLNLEFRLDNVSDDLQSLDSIEWCGMHGPEFRGGGEHTIAYEKLRWLQPLKYFNCTVTSSWTNNEDHREFHTWRAWVSRVRRRPLDCIMGLKDVRFVQSEGPFLGSLPCGYFDRGA